MDELALRSSARRYKRDEHHVDGWPTKPIQAFVSLYVSAGEQQRKLIACTGSGCHRAVQVTVIRRPDTYEVIHLPAGAGLLGVPKRHSTRLLAGARLVLLDYVAASA